MEKHFFFFVLSNALMYVTISAITLFQVVVFRVERRESVELTVLCLVYRGSQVLLQKRVKPDWQGYALPGGHVEAGESIVDAVIREMQEETGLRIFHPRLCGLKQFPIDRGRYLVFLFKTQDFAGQLRSSAEGQMVWVERSQIPELPTVADFQELLSVFDRDDLTEFQYIPHHGAWDVQIR